MKRKEKGFNTIKLKYNKIIFYFATSYFKKIFINAKKINIF